MTIKAPLSLSSDGSEAARGLMYARLADYYDEVYNGERKWSPSATAMFTVIVSGLLWLAIVLGATWLLGAF